MAPTSPVSVKPDQEIIFEARARAQRLVMNEAQREETQRLHDLAELGLFVKQNFHVIIDGLNCAVYAASDQAARPTLLGLQGFKETLKI